MAELLARVADKARFGKTSPRADAPAASTPSPAATPKAKPLAVTRTGLAALLSKRKASTTHGEHEDVDTSVLSEGYSGLIIEPQVLRVSPLALQILDGRKENQKDLFMYFRLGFKGTSPTKTAYKTSEKQSTYDFR